jgi:hypothetical protein
MKKKHQYLLMGAILLVVAGWTVWYTGIFGTNNQPAQSHSDKVHVHSDFAMYINGSKVDLTDEKYQSTTYDPKHLSFHLHDEVDNMLHRHANGITLGDFMSSIGFTLTDECITTDLGEEYCAGEDEILKLYVNGEVQESVAEYITQEEDQILLYFGDGDSGIITQLIENVTDEACIYSGNCPERGDPPYESCAQTCEI